MSIWDVISRRLSAEADEQEKDKDTSLTYLGNGLARTSSGGQVQVNTVTNSALGIGETLPSGIADGSSVVHIDSQPRVRVRRERRRVFDIPEYFVIVYRVDLDTDGDGYLDESQVWVSGLKPDPILVHTEKVRRWTGQLWPGADSESASAAFGSCTASYSGNTASTSATKTSDEPGDVIRATVSSDIIFVNDVVRIQWNNIFTESIEGTEASGAGAFGTIRDEYNFWQKTETGIELTLVGSGTQELSGLTRFQGWELVTAGVDAGVGGFTSVTRSAEINISVYRFFHRLNYAAFSGGQLHLGLQVLNPEFDTVGINANPPMAERYILKHFLVTSSRVTQTGESLLGDFVSGEWEILSTTGTAYAYQNFCDKRIATLFPNVNYSNEHSFEFFPFSDIDQMIGATDTVEFPIYVYDATDFCDTTYLGYITQNVQPLPADVTVLAILPDYGADPQSNPRFTPA